MLWNIVLLVLGFVLLVRGADVFVDGAVAMLAVYCCSLQPRVRVN